MLRTSGSFRFLLSVLAMAILAVETSAHAAILVLDGVQRISSLVTTPVDLTALGGVDWAYWAPTSGTVVTPPIAPTNDKLGGDAIGNVSNIGGTGLRGSASSTTLERYSFSDGTSPTSGTNASLAGLLFNGDIGTNSVGKGFQFSITGDPAQERLVTLYLGGFATTSNLTLSLNGVAVPITDSKVFTNANPKQLDVYTLHFRPDSASDVLLVQYTASAPTDPTNAHVGLQAVTVAAVPEPATATLLCLAGLALCRRRRSTRA
jgi:hypothetical protein